MHRQSLELLFTISLLCLERSLSRYQSGQAAYANKLPGNGPIARAAFPLLSGKAKSMLPNADDPQTAFIDVDWWANNFAEATQRYKQWLLG